MAKETIETKIIFALPRLLRRLFGGKNKARAKRGSINRELVQKEWLQIEEKMSLNNPSAFQSAIISADKLLDHCLKELGARGETMGERLKDSQSLFVSYGSYQAAWEGHKQRNRLVHEHDADFMHYEARDTISKFKDALKGLSVL
ncbi:hypothetical protein KBB60_02475 [Patescibacteria group bacterium]|nr:hypothetical protein [Patescibacteria group bacterium]